MRLQLLPGSIRTSKRSLHRQAVRMADKCRAHAGSAAEGTGSKDASQRLGRALVKRLRSWQRACSQWQQREAHEGSKAAACKPLLIAHSLGKGWLTVTGQIALYDVTGSTENSRTWVLWRTICAWQPVSQSFSFAIKKECFAVKGVKRSHILRMRQLASLGSACQDDGLWESSL